MSTPAIVGILKTDRDWSGVYVRMDGNLEAVGARLIREMNDAGGTFDRLVGRVLSAPQGWQSFLEEPYGKAPTSPCPRGATPGNAKRADVAFVYLLERSGMLHVLTTPGGTAPLKNHVFAGLEGFDRICSVQLTTANEVDLLQRSVEGAPLWQIECSPTDWSPGAVARKEISDLLARTNAKRSDCSAQLGALLKQKLGIASGPVMVRYGISHLGLETDLDGLSVRTMRDESPAGRIEVLAQSGATFMLDQNAILPELAQAHPALFAVATAILTKRAGWLLEVISWIRQAAVPDPLKNHLPFTALRHADGRTWAVEVLQTEGWPPKGRVTIAVSDADGDVFERARDVESFEVAQVERERLIAEMQNEGFAPTAP